MIAYITGVVAETADKQIVVEAGGIGYAIYVTGVFAARLGIGEQVRVYTHYHVAEEAQKLYGFETAEEREMFRQVISVSGIGPKAGMAVMSAMTVDELRLAVISEDEKKIARTPGLGAKTAKKLILELKDKMKTADILGAAAAGGDRAETKNAEREDAIQALMALGYSASEALKAVSAVDCTGLNSGAIVKLAFRELAR